MCGIVGYIGKKRKASFLIGKLKKLEYRGYDSAGIACFDNGKDIVYKAVGNISKLEVKIPENLEIEEAMAHTRWATNGEPSELNAHPHQSHNKTWSVVHNGIIENYKDICEKLKTKPLSSTDTSVVAEYLEEKQVQNIEGFIDAFLDLTGSYAIVAKNIHQNGTLYLAKYRSPLYVAKNSDNEFLIASDPICFAGFAKTYYTFENYEFAQIIDSEIKFYNKDKKLITKTENELNDNFENVEKNGYDTFMLKEIMEQPEAIQRQLKYYKTNSVLKLFDSNFISNFNDVILVGCGTAYHAAKIGAKYIQKLAKINAKFEMASEFIYSKPIFVDNKTLFIVISQSGETADTISALDIAKNHGAKVIALTNVTYSTIAKKADYVLPVCAGPEIAVASTKAYTCQLSALYMLASSFANVNENIYFDKLTEVSNNLLKFDFDKLNKIAQELKDKRTCIFIGKDIDYITACEASLKLKEISYITSLDYPSGELKHGFLALVEKGTPVFVFANNKEINTKTINAANEAKSRGAKLIIYSNEKFDIDSNDYEIFIDGNDEMLSAILAIVPAQYLAYKTSVLKGINPDQPRNLAKSVTVE